LTEATSSAYGSAEIAEAPPGTEEAGSHGAAAAGESEEHTEHVEHGGILFYPLKKVEEGTGVAVPEFAVWGWIIAIGLAIMATRVAKGVSRIPKAGIASFFELCVDGLSSIAKSFIGPGFERHVPFIGSLFIFILCCNLSGIVPGVASPTGAMGPNAETIGFNTTIALGFCAFLYVQIAGFRQCGLGYLKHFVGDPWWLFPINIPIHIIGEAARPVSLAVRLFGNVGGEDKILHVLAAMAIISIPLHWPLTAFAVFTGFLQAFVFSGLVCAYLQGTMPHHEEHAEAH